MFEAVYRRKRLLEAGPQGVAGLMDGQTYAERIVGMRSRGEISRHDPRLSLDPAQIRSYSEMHGDELMSRYGRVVDDRFRNAASREERVRYAAIARAGRQGSGILTGDAKAGPAASAEAGALMAARANPGDPASRELLTISAALSDRAQRDRAQEGFRTRNGQGNISAAAKQQGRSWLEVRDDLVKFGVLDPKDPRAKIRPADIDFQKGGKIRSGKVASAADLEAQAMQRFKKDPRDEQAMGWLATAGALQGPKEARKVKGTLPPKKGVLKRGLDIEL